MGTRVPDNTILSLKLRKLREGSKMSVNAVGAVIGRHGSRISKWETGEGFPTHGDLLAYAKLFGVSLELLCDDTVLCIDHSLLRATTKLPPRPHPVPRTGSRKKRTTREN